MLWKNEVMYAMESRFLYVQTVYEYCWTLSFNIETINSNV